MDAGSRAGCSLVNTPHGYQNEYAAEVQISDSVLVKVPTLDLFVYMLSLKSLAKRGKLIVLDRSPWCLLIRFETLCSKALCLLLHRHKPRHLMMSKITALTVNLFTAFFKNESFCKGDIKPENPL